eukprot:117132-Chlamydomonas_euryale.AAC.16
MACEALRCMSPAWVTLSLLGASFPRAFSPTTCTHPCGKQAQQKQPHPPPQHKPSSTCSHAPHVIVYWHACIRLRMQPCHPRFPPNICVAHAHPSIHPQTTNKPAHHLEGRVAQHA